MLGVQGQKPQGLGAELPAARGLRKDKKTSDFWWSVPFSTGRVVLGVCNKETKRFGGWASSCWGSKERVQKTYQFLTICVFFNGKSCAGGLGTEAKRFGGWAPNRRGSKERAKKTSDFWQLVSKITVFGSILDWFLR